jgi:hypothetical protein
VLPVFSEKHQGIQFRHHGNPTKEKYLIETMGGGVALLDYNNDGLMDIFLVNSGAFHVQDGQVVVDRSKPAYWNALYRNNGDGSFTNVTEKAGLSGGFTENYGMGVATGDYNNDGFVDLYVTSFGKNVLYRNNGDGTFTDVTEAAGVAGGGWSASAGFFDYDNDGRLDLFVTRYLEWDFSKNQDCRDKNGARTYCAPAHFAPVTNILYHNNGDGTFTDVSRNSGIAKVAGKGLGVAFNDYDGDGYADILVANDAMAQYLFHNNGDGTFSERGLEAGIAFNENGGAISGMGVDFGDYNNDGRPDVVITDLAKELYALYRNVGGGNFECTTRQSNLARISAFGSGWGVRLIDYDNDGWKDLFVVQSHVMDNAELLDPRLVYRQPPLVARNIRGKFEDVSSQSGPVFRQPIAGRGAAFGDLDNDGDIDVAINVLNDSPRLLYNNASQLPNRWLEIRSVGTVSNREGLGAAIKVVGSSGFEQWGYVTTTCSYLSACDPRVHFGLGDDVKAASIEIRWPSGIRQILKNVEVNRILTVTEPGTKGPLKR